MSMGVVRAHRFYWGLVYALMASGLLSISFLAYLGGVAAIYFGIQPGIARFLYSKPWAVDEFLAFRHGSYYDGGRVHSWRSFARTGVR